MSETFDAWRRRLESIETGWLPSAVPRGPLFVPGRGVVVADGHDPSRTARTRLPALRLAAPHRRDR